VALHCEHGRDVRCVNVPLPSQYLHLISDLKHLLHVGDMESLTSGLVFFVGRLDLSHNRTESCRIRAMNERLQGLWRDLEAWQAREQQIETEINEMSRRAGAAHLGSAQAANAQRELEAKATYLKNIREDIEQIRERMQAGG